MLARFDRMPLLGALIGAVALLGCSDPVPPAASGGMYIHISQGAGCPVTGAEYSIGNPAPSDFDSGTAIFDGEDGVQASCKVAGSGSSFTISAHIAQSKGMRYSLGVDNGVVNGGMGTATITTYVPDAVVSMTSMTPCALRVISTQDPATGGSVFKIQPGSAWVHFDCTDLQSPPSYNCSADGAFLVGNCQK